MEDNRNKKINQIRRAVALKYDPTKNEAPSISASGRGWLADNIIKLAGENSIPIVEDTALAKVLGNLQLGEEVPRELYEAVAAIYAFILEADQRRSV